MLNFVRRRSASRLTSLSESEAATCLSQVRSSGLGRNPERESMASLRTRAFGLEDDASKAAVASSGGIHVVQQIEDLRLNIEIAGCIVDVEHLAGYFVGAFVTAVQYT